MASKNSKKSAASTKPSQAVESEAVELVATNDRLKQNWMTNFSAACLLSRTGMLQAATLLQDGVDLGYLPGGSDPITEADTMESNLAGIDLTKLPTLELLLQTIQTALAANSGAGRVALTEYASFSAANK